MEFNIGDKVRITNTQGYLTPQVGDTGTVTARHRGGRIEVYIDRTKQYLIFLPDYLALLNNDYYNILLRAISASETARAKAIRECKELWTEIEQSGLSKNQFLSTPAGAKWVGRYDHDCPLCGFVGCDSRREGNCSPCPLPGDGGYRCAKALGYEHSFLASPSWFETIRNLK